MWPGQHCASSRHANADHVPVHEDVPMSFRAHMGHRSQGLQAREPYREQVSQQSVPCGGDTRQALIQEQGQQGSPHGETGQHMCLPLGRVACPTFPLALFCSPACSKTDKLVHRAQAVQRLDRQQGLCRRTHLVAASMPHSAVQLFNAHAAAMARCSKCSGLHHNYCPDCLYQGYGLGQSRAGAGAAWSTYRWCG